MEIYKNWLSENGVKFEETQYGLSFKYQGGYFIINNPGDDIQYFSMVMPGIFDFKENTDIPREKVIAAINDINNRFKVVKAVYDDEDCWLCTEIFIDSSPDIEDFMERLLGILHRARMEFFQYLREN